MVAEHTEVFLPHSSHLLHTIITQPAGAKRPEKPSILVLHGAGSAQAENGEYLATHLAQAGHASVRLSHSGHGRSTGHVRRSSLAQQLAQAQSALSLLTPPVTLIGTSMGAHTATLLSRGIATRALVCIAPATYGMAQQQLPFGPDFAFHLTLPAYWKDSLAWASLQAFTGQLLLITAGQEERVPSPIARLYWENAVQAQRTQVHFASSPHSIRSWLQTHPEYLPHFFRPLLACLAPQK